MNQKLINSYTPTIEEYQLKKTHKLRIEGGFYVSDFSKNLHQDKILVTIITVVFNGEKYLENTIQSVLNQTYKNIEYIIIDGGSTDKTIDIIRRYDKQISYWLSEPDEGISDAFNKGISLSKGEIIGILSSDDWYEENTVEIIVKQFMESSAEIICGSSQFWNNDKKDFISFSRIDLLEQEMTVNHATVFIKKDIYWNFGLFKTYQVAMDYDLLLRFKLNNVKFLVIPDILANVRVGGVSNSEWLKSKIWITYQEVAEIKTSLLGNKAKNIFYFYYSVIRGYTAGLLRKIGLLYLVNLYRKYFSIWKRINSF